MNCLVCGAENPANARCCSKCGSGLLALCSSCSASLPSGARFCPACGQPASTWARTPAPGSLDKLTPATQPGERKQVTVLFADFCGFTAFSGQLDPEDLHDHMRSLWARLDPVITAHGGTVEKHIGDALMAVFGGKQAREEDPTQAVRAGLAMQVCLGEARAAGAPPLRLRIGINTGLVVVGPVGATGALAAVGDTVTLASRLEQRAPPGGVLISHDTYRHIYGLFDIEGQPPLIVRGKSEPVQTYLVKVGKRRALARQMRGVEGLQTEMVGRETELMCLQSAFQRTMKERKSRIITIVGEAGMGKSRLMGEFLKWVDPLPEFAVLFNGRATAEMANLPFSLLRDVFAGRFDIQESDPAAAAREKLEQGFSAIWTRAGVGAANAPEAAPVQAHFIGQLLGLDFSASPHLRGILHDPEQVRQRAFHCLGQFFEMVSRGLRRPGGNADTKGTLLVLDDIQWSDDGSLDWVGHLAGACQAVPLMIVCLARPILFERRPAWGEGLPGHACLHLEALSRRESRLLVETILRKAPEIPQALRELIVGEAEGNPFYVEEIIQMLIDERVIVTGGETWRIEPARLAAATLPPTLTGVLQARLDSLPPVERAVLQRASVIGRTFWDTTLERLGATTEPTPEATPAEAPLARPEIRNALQGLRRKELILCREASAFTEAVEYAFKHDLLRQVAYESVLKKVRRVYHGQVGAWLIENGRERVMEFAGLVAAHFEQAARASDAAEWYGRAGQQARTGYAPASAIGFFQKALALLPADHATGREFQDRRMDWQEGLGEALGAQARFDEAEAVFEAERVLAEDRRDLAAQARAWNGLAFLAERQGNNRASVERAERAEALARDAGAVGRAERIRAMHLKGWAFYRLGDAPAVLAAGEQTLELCLEFGDQRGLATSYKLRGVAHLQLGRFQEADRYFEQGLAIAQELGDRRNACAMWNNLGESARLRGDSQAAAELYQRALALAQEIGHRESEIIYLSNLAGARLGLRQFEKAEADLRRVINLAAAPTSCALSEAYSFLSEARLGQGKGLEALSAARHALSLAQASESDLDLGGAWRALARARAAVAEPNPGESPTADPTADPRACFAESLQVFKAMNAEGEQARTLRAWAEFERQQGRPEESRGMLERARAIFARLGAAGELAQMDVMDRPEAFRGGLRGPERNAVGSSAAAEGNDPLE